MNTFSPIKKQRFIYLAAQEGQLYLKGDEAKAGPNIEKYLAVFRDFIAQRNSQYLDLRIGYEWCCAYVYYLMKQAGYHLSPTPLHNSTSPLTIVKSWYHWAMQEQRFLDTTYEPEAGDLVLFDRLIENVELDHIGIVLENNFDSTLTSEGNYYNCSGIFKRKKDNTIRGYIRL